MRTTLDIEDDVLSAAKELAAKENTTAGAIISRLARQGLRSPPGRKTAFKNGVPVFPARDEIITVEHVQKLIDEEGP